MSKSQFSLSFMFFVIAVLAMACAALVNVSPLWASVSVTFTVVVLLTSLLFSINRTGTACAFWAAMTIAGSLYFTLYFWPAYEFDDFTNRRISERLLTTWIADMCYERLLLPEDEPDGSGSGFTLSFGFGEGIAGSSAGGGSWSGGVGAREEEHSDFLLIAHCYWSLAIGIIAGIANRFLYLSRISA